MPRYVCDECGNVFDSKAELESHDHSDTGKKSRSSFNLALPSFLKELTLTKIVVLFGILLMSTLFLGTAFFTSTLSGGGGGDNAPGSDTVPPAGYTVQHQDDIPVVSGDRIPENSVSSTPLEEDVQVHLLAQPSVLLQYSCSNCNGTVQSLKDIADRYNAGRTRVYVAPYPAMESRVAATAFQRGPVKMGAVNRTRIENFICSMPGSQPVACAVDS